MRFTPYRHLVQYYETDQMGVVHHSNYIRWFEEARVSFMDQMGFGYNEMEKAGVSSPVIEARCVYRTSARFHDEVLVFTHIDLFTGTRMTVSYRVVDAADGSLRAEGETRHCFLNRAGRPISLKRDCPAAFALFGELAEQDLYAE
ncbi:MAG: thioesterase family protein [Oscillospiraceae bacterium]|nr:thioesterase family protein [Oscillospiraceae bacterium]